jgi:hypothetical protein
MLKIAQLNDSIFSGVLHARYLETILWISGSQMSGRNSSSKLMSECSQVFAILSTLSFDNLIVFWGKQVLRLTLKQLATSLHEMVKSITVEHKWPMGEGQLLEVHAVAMFKNIQQNIFEREGLATTHFFFAGGALNFLLEDSL